MAKYIKKPVIVEAELFKIGMHDGYGCYDFMNDKFLGYYPKNHYPKVSLRPAIKTLEGWCEVQEGMHYIVTGVRGERYPVIKDIFEDTYKRVYFTEA